jgi:mono/diheme cytochrome c family protein
MRAGVALASITLTVGAAGCKKSQASEPTAEGASLFASTCARCHGAEGTGGLPVAEGGPPPRNFRDHAFQASRSDADLRRTIKEGKSTGMPPFGGLLTDAQIDALVVQVRSFDPEREK